MSIRIAGGRQENGIVIGNAYDKYGSRNPIVKWMMKGFETSLDDLVAKAAASSIHEVGCGEGRWVLRWNGAGVAARGSDFSNDVIGLARDNARSVDMPEDLFEVRSIYELDADRDGAELVVCCEVLEHLDDPGAGLHALQRVARQHLIVSVPREPLWCALNLARGKYISRFGNTPGHVQHWSKAGFVRLVSRYFEVVEVHSPLPWTMLLCRPYR